MSDSDECRKKSERLRTQIRNILQSVDCFNLVVIFICLLPVVFVISLAVPKPMGDDGISTAWDLLQVLMDATAICEKSLETALPPIDDNGYYLENYCKGEWDNIICWPNSEPGKQVTVDCPDYIVDFNHDESAKVIRYCEANGTWRMSQAKPNSTYTDYTSCLNDKIDPELILKQWENHGRTRMEDCDDCYYMHYGSCNESKLYLGYYWQHVAGDRSHASRHCGQNGEWVFSDKANKTWVDYSDCYKYLPLDTELHKNIAEGTPRIKSLIQLYTVGYSFSLVALTFAMIILGYFQRLHCTRNYIHMHLFASFMLRAVVIFVKDKVLFLGAGIFDVQSHSERSLEELMILMKSTPGSSTYLVGCKIVMTLFHYFVATNYYWILVEALYLHSLIFVAFFSDKKFLWRFILTGWGVPILFVVPWAIVRGTLEDTNCWDIAVTEYKWIYNGPIVVANVINFLLFLNIIRVLWYKMRERGAISRTDNRRQYKKLAKSTLVLIPMFGVHAIVFIGMPDSVNTGLWWDIRMYFDLFFNSFQGFFVAIIYCFCNGEVQAEFKKAWERFNLSVEMQRGKRERSRSSVTMLTSFQSSMSHQTRLSIGGQTNERNCVYKSNQTTNNNNHLTTCLNGNGVICHEVSKTRNTDVECSRTNGIDILEEVDENEQFLTSENPSRNSRNISIILPIQEEDVEEEEFEKALEEETTVEVAGRNNKSKEVVVVEHEHESDNADDNSSSVGRVSLSCDTDYTTAHCTRIPSCDSGISSMIGGAMFSNPTAPPTLTELPNEGNLSSEELDKMDEVNELLAQTDRSSELDGREEDAVDHSPDSQRLSETTFTEIDQVTTCKN